ncbi:MAG: alpha/beta hydrolase, partial [Pseudomonadota bacterium]
MSAMKIRDAQILIVPGYKNSGEGHWQTRWQNKMPNASRVKQEAWSKPERDKWVGAVRQAIEDAELP